MYFFNSLPPSEQDKGKIPPLEDFETLGLDPNDSNALSVLSTIIKPDDVIGAIRHFVEDRKEINPIEVCICYYMLLCCSHQFETKKQMVLTPDDKRWEEQRLLLTSRLQ